MKKSIKWGKRRELFENEHEGDALRASPSIIPDHTCVLAYEQSQKQDETPRNNVKNRQKCEKYTKTKKKQAKNSKSLIDQISKKSGK